MVTASNTFDRNASIHSFFSYSFFQPWHSGGDNRLNYQSIRLYNWEDSTISIDSNKYANSNFEQDEGRIAQFDLICLFYNGFADDRFKVGLLFVLCCVKRISLCELFFWMWYLFVSVVNVFFPSRIGPWNERTLYRILKRLELVQVHILLHDTSLMRPVTYAGLPPKFTSVPPSPPANGGQT